MPFDGKPKAVIFYGPPGSGKGTQAEIVADKFGFEHFDTGELLEKTVNDPDKQGDPVIQREKKKFDDGVLCTPEWVTEIVKEAVKKIYQSGKGIVFSGSPRTLYEAERFFPLLEELYGERNVYVLRLNIPPEESIFRNSHRRICKKCGYSIVYKPENEKLKECPKCDGKLVTRGALDEPETIKVRLREYEERTVPIFKFLEGKGKKIIDIESMGTVKEVAERVSEALANSK